MISEVRKIYMQDIIIGICVTYPTRIRGVTFHSLLVTRWNLLVACYSWQKLLVAKKSLVTRCKIRSLLVAEILCCKKSLVTRCKISSFLVAEVAPCKKSLITRCKICLLFVAKVARYSLQKLLVAKNHSLLIALLISIATYYAK